MGQRVLEACTITSECNYRWRLLRVPRTSISSERSGKERRLCFPSDPQTVQPEGRPPPPLPAFPPRIAVVKTVQLDRATPRQELAQPVVELRRVAVPQVAGDGVDPELREPGRKPGEERARFDAAKPELPERAQASEGVPRGKSRRLAVVLDQFRRREARDLDEPEQGIPVPEAIDFGYPFGEPLRRFHVNLERGRQRPLLARTGGLEHHDLAEVGASLLEGVVERPGDDAAIGEDLELRQRQPERGGRKAALHGLVEASFPTCCESPRNASVEASFDTAMMPRTWLKTSGATMR
ncbi:hypothetical protein DFJ74DRAFT_674852 [Hyaloraphidium curvatum]|nr:hypothetical protein DFJ74DRAFT_674852 [Hyaloraphidium curvatum]